MFILREGRGIEPTCRQALFALISWIGGRIERGLSELNDTRTQQGKNLRAPPLALILSHTPLPALSLSGAVFFIWAASAVLVPLVRMIKLSGRMS